MKLKKLLAVLTAMSLILGMVTAIPASASSGTLTFKPGAGTPDYEIKITGTATIAQQSYALNHEINIGSVLRPTATNIINARLRSTANPSLSATVASIRNVNFCGSAVTNINGNITIGFQNTNNQIIAGPRSTFTWSATIKLSDSSKHPITDLGFTATGFEYLDSSNAAPLVTIPVYNLDGSLAANPSATFTFTNWNMEVTNAATSQFVPKNTDLSTAVEFGNGQRMSVADCAALKAATRFDVTVNFDKAPAVNTMEVFSLTTSLNNTLITLPLITGTSITFSDVPKRYFYDSASQNVFGGQDWDYTFKWLRISTRVDNPLNITSIVITYSGSSGNNNNNNNNNNNLTEFDLNFNAITLAVGAGKTSFLAPRLRSVESGVGTLTFKVLNVANSDPSAIRLHTGGSGATSNARIEAVKRGRAVIEAKTSDGRVATCVVEVVPRISRPVQSFEFTLSSANVYTGAAYQLMAPANMTVTANYSGGQTHNDRFQWFTTDPHVARVSDGGRVTVNNPGRVSIIAVTHSGIMQTITLNARHPFIAFPGNNENASVRVGNTHRIGAGVGAPRGTTLSYSSSNESIATVSSTGVISGKARGSTNIQVRAIGSNGAVLATRVFRINVT